MTDHPLSGPTPDGGPAFPRDETERNEGCRGMSLRDYFAGQALAGICANPTYLDCRQTWSGIQAAIDAGGIADAMLEERAKTSDGRANALFVSTALRNALAELIACKELKDRAITLVSKFDDPESCARVGLRRAKMMEEYELRKPLAWAAAISAIRQSRGTPCP